MNDRTSDYLRHLLPEKETWETALEQQASDEGVPIMEPESMAFIKQIIRLKRPRAILEIGTAIGYSALQMHWTYPDADIVTIERDADRYAQAKAHIKTFEKEERIHIILGEALEVLGDLNDYTFDVVLIDAAKGQYRRFFEQIEWLLNEQALVISDNVLFKGYVTGEVNMNKRYKKLAEKINAFNTWLSGHTQYDTSIVPIGDGIAISLKK